MNFNRYATGKILLALYFGVLIAQSQLAFAYIDPGNGSLILQLLMGGVAGISVFLKLYWNNVVAMFQGAPAKADAPSNTDNKD